MGNIHAINTIPNQVVINSISSFRSECERDPLNYYELLFQIKTIIHEQGFMQAQDNALWMQQRGNDYLTNPKLFCNAPLTYLCAFLGELFNRYEVEELQEKLTPQILLCALTRLEKFKL